MNRREHLRQLSSLAILPLLGLTTADTKLMRRTIPGKSETLPVVGLGTWQTFDAGPDSYAPIREVLSTLVEQGGSVIDSSPMYGKSEEVVGTLSTELNLNAKLFIATKVWIRGQKQGIGQMNESFAKLKRGKIDLMQIHNLVDWANHMKTLTEWKAQGRVRYIGLTHYTVSSHETVEEIMRNNKVDFIQINYNLLDRNAEKRLLPAARDLGVGVLVNRPFEEGALFSRVNGKSLPEWAGEFDCASWGQFFLKYILSHPAVTCVIPGTSKVKHLADNLGAGMGKLPDESQRAKMVEWVKSL